MRRPPIRSSDATRRSGLSAFRQRSEKERARDSASPFPFFCSPALQAFFRPDRGSSAPRRIGAVKAGLGVNPGKESALRPSLDSAEHGGRFCSAGRSHLYSVLHFVFGGQTPLLVHRSLRGSDFAHRQVITAGWAAREPERSRSCLYAEHRKVGAPAEQRSRPSRPDGLVSAQASTKAQADMQDGQSQRSRGAERAVAIQASSVTLDCFRLRCARRRNDGARSSAVFSRGALRPVRRPPGENARHGASSALTGLFRSYRKVYFIRVLFGAATTNKVAP